MNWKQKIPWQAQMIVKLLSAHIPLIDGFRLQKFKRGSMSQPDKAYQIFQRHFERVNYLSDYSDFTILELGPGASLFSAILARAFGVKSTYLVDVENCATEELQPYLDLISFLHNQKNMNLAEIQSINTLNELLEFCQQIT
ncbi:hypothetical protein H1P_190039 [Hyella patelloides LEGE 07179]|uniref:Class I SAM-dependent methyltransferase n=1 Tax=Hyella patelloides LEGE 07179 TaxID=945734 RepID=A0A563VP94_9CYAN|nr:hypothetical protein [Hyella patelloides]VEP13240.1 hypothetical protein H1P_190039 [Hyella patelloides LEGE 07179]